MECDESLLFAVPLWGNKTEKEEARLRKNTKASILSAHLGQSFTHCCLYVHGEDAIAGAMSHVSGLIGKDFDLFGPNK